MFGLFKSKKVDKDQEILNQPEYLELIAKWDAFLSKIEVRFEESIVNAEEALTENLIESDYDITTTLKAWSGIRAQLSGLSETIDHTFDNKVKPQMLEYVERWHIIDQNTKGSNLRSSIYKRINRFEIQLEGKLAQMFYDHAIQFQNEAMHCTQCSAEIEVKKDLYRSHYVSCDYCNTVNTFTPNDKIAQIDWIAAEIAKSKAINEWDEKELALEQYQELPSRTEKEGNEAQKAAYKVVEDAERKYWTRYFTEKYTLVSENKEKMLHDIEVKMQHIYEKRKNEFNY